MRKKILFVVLLLLAINHVYLGATEHVVMLKLVSFELIIDVNPLDDVGRDNKVGPNVDPNSFRVVVSGKDLSITKQDDAVVSADVVVLKSTTGEVVVNEAITDDIVRQIPSNGNYTISIQTSNAALVGHFVVR